MLRRVLFDVVVHFALFDLLFLGGLDLLQITWFCSHCWYFNRHDTDVVFGAFVVVVVVIVVVLLVIETRLSVDGDFVKGGEPVPVSKEGGFCVHGGNNKGHQ